MGVLAWNLECCIVNTYLQIRASDINFACKLAGDVSGDVSGDARITEVVLANPGQLV